MNCSTPGLPVHYQPPESTQTHVHWVSDAIQPSHPLSSPSPPALNISQHQGLFKWASSSHQVVKVLEFQLQHQSFQWTPRTDSFRMDWLDLEWWFSEEGSSLHPPTHPEDICQSLETFCCHNWGWGRDVVSIQWLKMLLNILRCIEQSSQELSQRRRIITRIIPPHQNMSNAKVEKLWCRLHWNFF